MSESPLEILYFSDVLCVWAYAGQVRLDELQAKFGDRVRTVHCFLNVYGDVVGRIQEHAGDHRDPSAAYAERMRQVAAQFDHTSMCAECFTEVVPRSSNQAHLLLCAVRLLIAEGALGDNGDARMQALVRRVRTAFFEEARDVGHRDVLFSLLEDEGVPRDAVERRLADGSAMAELSRDLMQKDKHAIAGSPTYLLDGGREKLFGNVGYRVIEANVSELLDAGSRRGASWC
ncbi:MAG: DsbA family protein [Sandaracinaceae bacterium]